MNEKYFLFDNLSSNVIHCFTKKPFDFNENLVKKEKVFENYKIIAKDFDYNFNYIKKSSQGHTNVVRVVDANNLADDFVNIDGMITNLPGVALVTYLADCQAILLYDPVNKVIGNIHSGWKGTLNKIINNAIDIMIKDFKCNPKNIRAFICPSILKCCFEVDEDVMLMFRKKFNDDRYFYQGEIKDNKQKYFIDTVKINIDMMLKLGIRNDNIVCSDICTKCNCDDFHSYRKDKDLSGRNIALICLK